MKLFCTFLIFIPLLSIGQTNLFDKGYWYKIGVTENGIYKINKNFLDEIGIDYSQPNTIKVFGNGIGMLPQANSAERPIGLIENSLKGYGLEDGIFDDNDFILFYADGPNNWTIYWNYTYDERGNKIIEEYSRTGNSWGTITTFTWNYGNENAGISPDVGSSAEESTSNTWLVLLLIILIL